MSAHRFSTGQSFYWNGNIYEVKRLLPDGQINIEDFASGAIQIVAVQQLVEALFAGDLQFLIETRPGKRNVPDQPLPEEVQIDLSDYPEHLVKKARFRLHVIKPLLTLNPSERTREVIDQRIQAVKVEIAADLKKQNFLRGLSRRSLFRWLGNYTASGNNLRALIDSTAQCGGRGKSRLDPEVKNLLESVIKDHYYRAEVVSIDDIMYLTAARMAKENQLFPGQEVITSNRE